MSMYKFHFLAYCFMITAIPFFVFNEIGYLWARGFASGAGFALVLLWGWDNWLLFRCNVTLWAARIKIRHLGITQNDLMKGGLTGPPPRFENNVNDEIMNCLFLFVYMIVSFFHGFDGFYIMAGSLISVLFLEWLYHKQVDYMTKELFDNG